MKAEAKMEYKYVSINIGAQENKKHEIKKKKFFLIYARKILPKR